MSLTWPKIINIMSEEYSRQEAALHNQHLIPTPESTEQIIARFPERHSCQHCQEDVINALNAKLTHSATFLRSRDHAIEAANDGCKLYEWLLLSFIRSQAPLNHGFYLQRASLKDPQDTSSVKFLIGTRKYTWPCAAFEVFTEAGKCPSLSDRKDD